MSMGPPQKAGAKPAAPRSASAGRARDSGIRGYFPDKKKKSAVAAGPHADPADPGAKPAWNFFAPAVTKTAKHAAAPPNGTSWYLLQMAKGENAYDIPSAKDRAGENWCTADAAPNAPHRDLLTPVERRGVVNRDKVQARFIQQHEAGLARRRAKDASRGTLDNQFRQQLGADGRPVMSGLIQASVDALVRRKPAAHSFIAENRRAVRAEQSAISCARRSVSSAGSSRRL
jgi:hypothetical protein